MKTTSHFLTCFAAAVIFAAADIAVGQTAPLSSVDVATPVDSGWVENLTDTTKVLWSGHVSVPGAPWIRLRFAEVRLGRSKQGESPAWLRITSAQDGFVQTMHARHVGEWRYTSAYFNGSAVDIDIVASAMSGPCRVKIDTVIAGAASASVRNICGMADDRLPSTDPRVCRIEPVGCTGWLIDDVNYCQLTAGHCVVSGNAEIVEFNVPPSTETGAIVHPPPSDQYAIDPASVQFTPGTIEIGEDWAYYGVFDNSTTLLTPYEAQGERFTLADEVPVPDNQTLRKTGFGSTDSTVPPSYNLAQKTLTGPFTNAIGTWLQYPIDTSGGDSGSPVFLEGTDTAIAVHTNGGCSSIGYNSGTSIENSFLQAALADPQGVCVPRYFEYTYPNGLPLLVDSSGGTTVRVSIVPRNLYEVARISGTLHYDAGDGWYTASVQYVEPGEWDIVFPPVPCARTLRYYISFETVSGGVSTDPDQAPTVYYAALTGSSVATVSSYDFETAAGWFVTNQDLTGGAWARAVPMGTGLYGEPTSDYDGSGQCYLTGITAEGDDVDGGPTRLWSPGVSMSGTAHPVVQYARWFTNNNQDEDRLVVEAANNSVVNFEEVESVVGDPGWVKRIVFLNDLFADPGTIRMRFSVADNPNNSRTEAAVDAVLFLDVGCDYECLKGDVNVDGVIDGRDISPFASALLSPPPVGTDAFCATDMDDDGVLNIAADLPQFVTCILGGPCP